MKPPNGDGAVMSPKATIYHFSLEGKKKKQQPLFRLCAAVTFDFRFMWMKRYSSLGDLVQKPKLKEIKRLRSTRRPV